MIDRATVERILDAAQIVDVVSDFVTLRKAGVNYKGLCPFHDDRTPSFVVSPTKGLCKCFACGKGGNAVHFIMEHEQLSYPDALRYLAKKYNIEIKEREHLEKIEDIKGVQKEITWGSQIRSYVFMPYTMVKDHRTGFETGNVQAVMDGEIDGFINAYLKQMNKGQFEGGNDDLV